MNAWRMSLPAGRNGSAASTRSARGLTVGFGVEFTLSVFERLGTKANRRHSQATRPPGKGRRARVSHRLFVERSIRVGGQEPWTCLGLEACGPVRHTAACRPSDRGTTRVRATSPALLDIAVGVVESSVLAGLKGFPAPSPRW